jgi:hypothetical protein
VRAERFVFGVSENPANEIQQALSILSLFLFVYFYDSNPSAAYFLMPFRFWEIGFGCLLGALSLRPTPILQRLRPLFSSVLIAAIIAILFRPKGSEVFNTVSIAVLSVFTIGSLRKDQVVAKILSSPPLRYIGLLSYSLYLWHWSVLVVSRWTTGIHPWTVPFQIAAIFVLSFTSYHYVENPLRRSQWALTPIGDIRAGFAIIGLASVAQIVLGILPDRFLYVGNKSLKGLLSQPKLATPYQLSDSSGNGWEGEKCLLTSNDDVGKQISMNDCTFVGTRSSDRKVLVIGNSMAAAMVPGFAKLATGSKSNVSIIASYGSSPVPGIANKTPWSKANDYYWSKVVPGLLGQLQRGDVVLIANELGTFLPHEIDVSAANNLKDLKIGLINLNNDLKARGLSLAIIHATPFIREAGCLPNVAQQQWFNGFGGPCLFHDKDYTIKRRSELASILSQLQANQGLVVIDLMNLYCPHKQCTFLAKDGTVLYRDGNGHPSVEAAKMAGDIITGELAKSAVIK